MMGPYMNTENHSWNTWIWKIGGSSPHLKSRMVLKKNGRKRTRQDGMHKNRNGSKKAGELSGFLMIQCALVSVESNGRPQAASPKRSRSRDSLSFVLAYK